MSLYFSPPNLILLFPEKIRELARHGETSGTSKAMQMLEHAIEKSRGGVFLKLTPEQHTRLKRP
jgi:hypothetical protein